MAAGTILFVTTDPLFGTSNRQALALARWVESRPVYVLSLSASIQSVARSGYAVEHFLWFNGDAEHLRHMNSWLKIRVEHICAAMSVTTVVAVGSEIPAGLLQALRGQRRITGIWMTEAVEPPRSEELEESFDYIIEATSVLIPDRSTIPRRKSVVKRVPPMMLTERRDLFSGKEAREFLGSKAGGTNVFVVLDRQHARLVPEVMDALESYSSLIDNVYCFGTVAFAARCMKNDHWRYYSSNLEELMLRVCDVAILPAEAAYLHQYLHLRVPALFILSDDLPATRHATWKRFAARERAVLVSSAKRTEIESCLKRLLNQPKRKFMRKKMAGLCGPNGARQAARLVEAT